MKSEEIIADMDKSEEDIIKTEESNSDKNCFICNNYFDSGIKYNLVLGKVNHSESQVTELLGRLVEDDWIVFVSDDDFLCHRCMLLLNRMDELEFNLKNVKDKLTRILKNNYNLVSSEFPSATDKVSDNESSTNDNTNTPEKHTVYNQTCDLLLTEQNATDSQCTQKLQEECAISKENHDLNGDQICKSGTLINAVKPKPTCQISSFNKNEVKYKSKNNTNKPVNVVQRKHNLITRSPTSVVNYETDLIFCEVCGIPVLKKNHKVHESTHNVSKYVCFSCDECFSDELSWQNHQDVCQNHVEGVNMNCNIESNCTENNILKSNVIVKVEDNSPIKAEDNGKGNSLTIATYNDLMENNATSTGSLETIFSEHYQDGLDNKTCFNSTSNTEVTYGTNLEPSLKTEVCEIDEQLLDVDVAGPTSLVSQIYKCGVCGFKDVSMLVVKNHVRWHDQVQRSFKCEYCHLSFTKKPILNLHVVRRHTNINSRHCLFCKKIFLDRTHLNLHIEKNHSDVKSNPFCAYCGKMHNTEGDLKIHILRHHFSDYGVQFSGEVALKDDSASSISNTSDDQKITNSPSTSNVFDEVFSKNLESNCQEESVKEKESSFYVKPKQETLEEPDVYCAMCDFVSKEDSEMTKHLACHQTTENNFCEICCQFFCSKDFSRHLNHGSEFQSLRCKYCNDLFHDTIHLKCHIKKIHQVGTQSCKYCSKVYNDRRAVLKHVRTKHMPKKVEKSCDKCDISFKNDLHYSNHVEYAHRINLQCKMCGKELQNWKKLQYHEKAHLKHSKTNYKCDICNKVLKTQTGLRFHKIRHTGNYPFFCEFCGQGFVSTHSLTEHIGHHTKETRYTCDVCGKGFFYYDTMYRHRILHDNPYPKTCDICNKNFRNSSRVAIHKRREHTGERPYKCTYCPQSFFTSNGYKHHLCLHTKVFPYNCKPCSKGFTTRHKYAIHLSRKHSDHTLLINRAPNNKEWNEQWLK